MQIAKPSTLQDFLLIAFLIFVFFRLKIIDQNDFPYAGESKSKTGRGAKNEPTEEVKEAENEALELMTTQEELPQVAGVVDDSR